MRQNSLRSLRGEAAKILTRTVELMMAMNTRLFQNFVKLRLKSLNDEINCNMITCPFADFSGRAVQA
jgi:hypothetical protein